MGLRNSDQEYGVISKLFHWIVVLLIIAMFVIASLFHDLPRGPEKLELIKLHASVGFLILMLMTLRLGWRLSNVRPDDALGVPLWQNIAARCVHWAFYVLIFAQVAAGMLTVATAGLAVPFFGLFELPLPIEKNEEWHEVFEDIHGTLPILILIAVVLHTSAALYHHFKLKDNVLRRMTVGLP